MFPGPYATVYRNEAGEVTGWDSGYGYEPEYDHDAYLAADEVEPGDVSDDEDIGYEYTPSS